MRQSVYVLGAFVFLTFFLLSPMTQALELPTPNPNHHATKVSRVIGWPITKTPTAPPGFTVARWADKFKNPRWIYVGPNGDVFVSEATGGNKIIILRGQKKNGKPELRQTFLSNLNQPFGMLIMNDWFFVATTDAVWRYPYKAGQTKITAKGKRISKLPSGGHHWTRNIVASPDGTKIYVAVGSASNVAESGMDREKRRANILEINLDGTDERVLASGLRNPVGMSINPGANSLWTTVNERDGLGEDLVPDYLTSVQAGGFYGWPYSYFGGNLDPRLKGEGADLAKKAIVPEVSLGAHTASLGLVFYNKKEFPSHYQEGAFIGQHGSWNRSEFSGYKVSFVPFTKGYASGEPEDFLTGFIANKNKNEVYGRPVGLAVDANGALLVADDGGNIIWKVSASTMDPDAPPTEGSGTGTPAKK